MNAKLLPLGLLATALAVTAGLPPEQQPKPETRPEPPAAPALPPELERMHADHVLRFAASPGFGKSRMIRMPQQLFITLAGTSYRVIRPDLIALETKPVAYRNPGEEEVIGMSMLTNRAAKAHLTTRPITKDEANAIMELRQGKDLVQQETVQHVPARPGVIGTEVRAQRVVGALRATAACAKCHEVPVGTLLGAFS